MPDLGQIPLPGRCSGNFQATTAILAVICLWDNGLFVGQPPDALPEFLLCSYVNDHHFVWEDRAELELPAECSDVLLKRRSLRAWSALVVSTLIITSRPSDLSRYYTRFFSSVPPRTAPCRWR